MNRKPDPKKAIVVKPNKRTLKKKTKKAKPQSAWQPHQSNAAIDAWGTAIHAMRAQGKSWD